MLYNDVCQISTKTAIPEGFCSFPSIGLNSQVSNPYHNSLSGGAVGG